MNTVLKLAAAEGKEEDMANPVDAQVKKEDMANPVDAQVEEFDVRVHAQSLPGSGPSISDLAHPTFVITP